MSPKHHNPTLTPTALTILFCIQFVSYIHYLSSLHNCGYYAKSFELGSNITLIKIINIFWAVICMVILKIKISTHRKTYTYKLYIQIVCKLRDIKWGGIRLIISLLNRETFPNRFIHTQSFWCSSFTSFGCVNTFFLWNGSDKNCFDSVWQKMKLYIDPNLMVHAIYYDLRAIIQ